MHGLAEDWEALAKRTVNPQPFFMPAWVRHWRRYMDVDRVPVIVCVWDSTDALQAFWPFVEMSGIGASGLWPMSFHTADQFAPLGALNATELAASLADGLAELMQEQAFLWLPLVSESIWIALEPILRERGLLRGACIKKSDTRLWTDFNQLDPEVLEPEGKVAKKRRYEWRQMEKLGAVRIEYLDTAETVEGFVPRWRWLERQSWKHEAQTGLLHLKGSREMYGALLPELAGQGSMCFEVLYVGEDVAACQIGLLDRAYYGLHNTAYHRAFAAYSPGTHLLLHSMRRARERGIGCYDFMQGAQDYKQKLATGSERLVDATLYARGWQGWTHRALRALFGGAHIRATQ